MNLYNILIVDDEVGDLNALEQTFKHDYNVFTATNGEAALGIMKQSGIALIIADHHMPIMTGVEFFEKTLDKYPNTIRIILAEYSDEQLLMDAINIGHIHSFITKPWDTEEIKAIVRDRIEAHEIARSGKGLYTRTLLQSGDISEEQLKNALNMQRDDTIGEILVERRIITRDQLKTAIKHQESEQKQLGEALIELGSISDDDLEIARGLQRHRIKRLAEILTELGYANEEDIFSCYALQLGMPYISVLQFPSNPELIEILPARLAYKYTIVPINLVGQVLIVAALEPLSDRIKNEIEEEIGHKVMAVCTSHQDMETALEERYLT